MRHVTDIFWSGVAMALSFMPSRFLIRLLLKISEPYQHIESADGSETYMGRWWLLNPYEKETYKPRYRWLPWNIRLHHIMREDLDRHLHSHPWSARTLIIKGYYIEERDGQLEVVMPGDTKRLSYGEYHRIAHVSREGVWTIFITGRKQGGWNFMVDGAEVPSAEYLERQR